MSGQGRQVTICSDACRRQRKKAQEAAKARERYANDPDYRARILARRNVNHRKTGRPCSWCGAMRPADSSSAREIICHECSGRLRQLAEQQNVSGTALRRLRVSPDAFLAWLKENGAACAICGGVSAVPIGGRSLVADHDHVSGLFRGLLCASCNTGLGAFYDRPELLEAAAEYLRRSPS